MRVKFNLISIVAHVLKYLAGEIGTPTMIILVVGIEVMNSRVCEEEEKAAHVDDEGPHMWWAYQVSTKLK